MKSFFTSGGEILSTFDDPDNVKIGHCDLIEEYIIGEEKVIKFSGMVIVIFIKYVITFFVSWYILNN